MSTKTKKPSSKASASSTVAQLQRQLANANDALEMALSITERDNNFFTGGLSSLYEGRSAWDRKKIFAESLRAWRVNPTARRIVRLQRSFIMGKGWSISVKPKKKGLIQKVVEEITGNNAEQRTQDFLDQWQKNKLVRFKKNTKRWYDELYRTGNLFLLFTVDESGTSFIRAVPAEQIEEIKTTDNDIEQEIKYTKDSVGEEGWDAYDPSAEGQTSFMLHYASNQPVGSVWGEADFSTLLVWIGRFGSWLEDRVRLNRFRTAFMFVIQGAYSNETERAKREKQLNANPPKPGSVLVTNSNNGEQWGILNANLDAFDASMDGTAIKKNILDGAGQPMHWHAEPESSTRTTAEAAGAPAFQPLEEDQDDFKDIVREIIEIVIAVKAGVDKGINPDAEIEINTPDITQRDNATLALALARSFPALAELYDRKLMDEDKFLKLIYRFMAEPYDGNAPKGLRRPLTAPGQPQGTPASGAGGAESVTDPSDPKEEEEE